MRRVLLAGVVSAAATFALTTAALGDETREAPVPVPQPVTAQSYYFSVGPSAQYDGDSGAIGEVRRRLAVPVVEGVGAYDAVVTVGLQYRTRGDVPFTAGFYVRTADYDYLEVQPASRPVAASPDGPTSATFVFRVLDLRPGVTYQLGPSVNARFAPRPTAISSSRVVVDVELVPR